MQRAGFRFEVAKMVRSDAPGPEVTNPSVYSCAGKTHLLKATSSPPDMAPPLTRCSILGIVFLFLGTLALPAATFNIANGDVAGPNGLKAAITASNTNVQDDTIELAAGGTYTLTARDNAVNGLPAINPDSGHSLTIHGNGATIQRSTAGGTPTFRIFQINSGSLFLSGLILTNGNPGALHGGAIYNAFSNSADSTLSVVNCTFNGNSGDYGGAIFNDGYQDPASPAHTSTLTVLNSTFSGNTGTQYGGAIWNESGGIVMNVSDSTFSQNTAVARDAGAIQFDGSAGTATGSISNCTFTQNSAANYGGAVNVDGQGGFNGNGDPTNGSAILPIINCTFSQNSATWGGAIALDGSDGTSSTGNTTVSVSNCTFSGNSAITLGGGIYLSETNEGTTVLHIGNTILAAGASGANLGLDNITGGTVTVTSHGYNLSSDGGAGVLTATADQINTNPLLDLAGLKNNGGPTMTIALQAGSPALDKGKSNTISQTNNDQRGVYRPFDDPNIGNASGGDGSDIGAYEADVHNTNEERIGNDLRLTFTTSLGRNYQIEHATSLTGTWSPVLNSVPPPPIEGTGGIVQVTVPNAFSAPGSNFYRVNELP
jgi:predicted outer membrane repeat protein